MALIQKKLLDFIDIPCALILRIDGEQRDPPIIMTKDDLENLFWNNSEEWERLTLHFLDGMGVPRPEGQVELERSEVFDNNHFLV